MASENELDLVTRALSGDRRARNNLFRDYFRDSAQVRRAGASYSDPLDFLHDCFTNFLRTGYAWDKQDSLSAWVESVASWTAVQHDRLHSMTAAKPDAPVRMCAEMEGEATEKNRLAAAYAPPGAQPGDTAATRVFSLLDPTQATVLRERAVSETSWEDTATAAGEPLDSIGPLFARALSRAVRFFGAPPPLDDDLEPIFSRTAANHGKPEGRAIAMQLDPEFYDVSPEIMRLGVKTSHDARLLVLWNAAASATPPDAKLRAHLDQCHYCASLLRSLLLLRDALHAAPDRGLLFCPGAFRLANAADGASEAFDRHLTECPFCPQERGGKTSSTGVAGKRPHAGEVPGSPGRKIAWVAAALVILGAGSFAGYYYYGQQREASLAAMIAKDSKVMGPTVAIDPRYLDLVQGVQLDDKKVMDAALPVNRDRLRNALDGFSLGDIAQAIMITSQIVENNPDPTAGTLYAMALYQSNLMSDGYRQMLKAEAMEPKSSYRCWIMMQFALMVAEKNVVAREVEHLANDPEYGARAKAIYQKFQARN